MLSHYRCRVTIGAKQRIDFKQENVTIGAKRYRNTICVKPQQSVSAM